ncbi:MAG TPA: hypothetical protein VIH25_10415 [Steroidobacteraceae bacterium]
MSSHRVCVYAFALGFVLGVPELLGMPGSTSALAQAADDGWRWSIAPYLWGSDVKTDVRFPSGQEVSGEAGFDDILDKLDIAAQVHAEGHRGEWGMFFDATYLTMSDDGSRGPIATEAEIDTGIYEVAAVYTPGGAAGRFSAFAGARILDLGVDLTFSGGFPNSPIRRSADKSYTDFMIGGRYAQPLSERWLLNLRGDIGGGDSESTWNALAVIGWRFGSDLDNAVLFGWRHMEMEFENEGVELDLTMDGPITGVLFAF